MGETRRKFDQDFREGAVRLVRETGKPIAQVSTLRGDCHIRYQQALTPKSTDPGPWTPEHDARGFPMILMSW
jgi:transposase-like protein